jgi:hypothetical protein
VPLAPTGTATIGFPSVYTPRIVRYVARVRPGARRNWTRQGREVPKIRSNSASGSTADVFTRRVEGRTV